MRPASLEDAEPICAIYNAAIAERGSTFETEPRSAGDFERRIDDARFPLLVGDAGEGVIGWAGLATYSSRPCYAGIGECSVYVAVDARGRGVGTALTEALAATAKDNGFHKLIGKLFTDNAASLRFGRALRLLLGRPASPPRAARRSLARRAGRRATADYSLT